MLNTDVHVGVRKDLDGMLGEKAGARRMASCGIIVVSDVMLGETCTCNMTIEMVN